MRKVLHFLFCPLLGFLLNGCSEDLTFRAEDIVTESALVHIEHQLTFVHISDIHRSNISLSPALYYLNNTPSSFGLLTGDIMATAAMLDEIRRSEKPMLLIPGNHDAYPCYYASVGQSGFRTRVLDGIGQGENVIFGNDYDNYWYQDFHAGFRTLRVIGIDQYEVESVLENPDACICVLSQQQLDWFVNLLENSESCDGIIIAVHAGFGNEHVCSRNTDVTNDFISIYARDYENSYDYNGDKNLKVIPDIVHAYQTGVNLIEKKYGNSTNGDTLVVTTHFQRPHDNFIAYIGGHAHMDMVEPLASYYPQQLQVLIAYCGKGTGSKYNDLVKNTNNRNSYNFNVNVIDFAKRQLKIIRKGANVKVDGSTRDSIVFNY